MNVSRFLFAASLTLGVAAQAMSVTYTFSGISDILAPNTLQTFTLTVPNYILADTVFTAGDLSASFSSGESITGVEFYLNDPFNMNNTSAIVNVTTASSGTFYFFTPGDYASNGLKTTQFSHPGTLEVVPEPASMLALAAGGAVLLRRRKARV